MKKIYLIIFSTIIAGFLSAQIPVAYYPFTGNANDVSGNANHGTANGAALAPDKGGNANNAYSFNGSSDNISVPDNATLAFTSNYTIISWINAAIVPPATASGIGFSIAAKDVGPGMNNPKWIFLLQNGNLSYHINGPGMGNGEWLYSNAFTLAPDEWCRVAMSKSGNSVSFYVNGVSVGTFLLTNSSVNPSTPLQLGHSEAGLGFTGSLDEMKFYNYALTSTEIATEYAGILPVTLIDFSATHHGNTVTLNWTTAFESELSHFEIESATEGIHFSAVANIPATGGANGKSYSATDHQPADGISYYRLKSIDKDGHFCYSNIIKIAGNKNYSTRIFPNPTHDFISIKGNISDIKELQIIDAAGHVVRKFPKSIDNNYRLKGILKGIYWVKIISDNESQVQKIMIE